MIEHLTELIEECERTFMKIEIFEKRLFWATSIYAGIDAAWSVLPVDIFDSFKLDLHDAFGGVNYKYKKEAWKELDELSGYWEEVDD